MDNSAPFQFPRFDEEKTASPLAVFDPDPQPETPSNVEAQAETVAEDPVTAEPDLVEQVEPDAPSPDDFSALQEEVQKTLEAFSRSMAQAETAITDQVTIALQGIVGALFPRLSEAFLAEEFARHIPDLAKLTPAQVGVQASPRVAEQLQLASENMTNWPTGWFISPVEGLEDTRVQVDWGNGGMTYDTEKILASCLGRLDEPIINTVER